MLSKNIIRTLSYIIIGVGLLCSILGILALFFYIRLGDIFLFTKTSLLVSSVIIGSAGVITFFNPKYFKGATKKR